eukprot:988191-Prymnesium_polylepis.1
MEFVGCFYFEPWRLERLAASGRLGHMPHLVHIIIKGRLKSPENEGTALELLSTLFLHPKIRPDRCPPVLGKWHDASPFPIQAASRLCDEPPNSSMRGDAPPSATPPGLRRRGTSKKYLIRLLSKK